MAEEYARLVAERGEVCAICGGKPKTRRLHIDHDHKTGRVRGLLCYRCNRFLHSWMGSQWLRAAAAYLEEPAARMTPTEWVDYLNRHPELRPTMSGPR